MAKATSKKAASKKTAVKKAASKKSAVRRTTSTTPSEDSMLLSFFKDELKDIYWAENHLLKEIPKMAAAATSKDLKRSFQEHLRQTRTQIKRLDSIFKLLGQKPQGKKCEAMDGITKECQGMIEDTQAGSFTRDVALILGSQKVEHYEISTYGGLSYVALAMGREDIRAILEESLVEERNTDNLLSRIAVFQVNDSAAKEKE